jgi:YbbR domain-containing protein
VQKLAVQPKFAGEPAFGYKILEKQIQLNPNAVLIEGPKAQIEKLQFVETEKIDLVGRIRGFRRTVQLQTPPNVKPMSESLIDVYIPIQEEFDEKNFSQIPVKILTPSSGQGKVQLEPSEVSFVLQGSRQQLEKLAPEKILAYVDLSEVESGEQQVPVQLQLPDEVRLKSDEALTVKAVVKK